MSNPTDFDGLKIESLSVAGSDISAIVETDAGRVEKRYRPSQLPPKLVLEVGDSLVELSVRSRKNGGSRQDAAQWRRKRMRGGASLSTKRYSELLTPPSRASLPNCRARRWSTSIKSPRHPWREARRLHERLLTLRPQDET